MAAIEFDIRDYEGAGPLHFGMMREDIENILGAAHRTSTRGGGLRLSWNFGLTTKLEVAAGSPDLVLCEIGFTPACRHVVWQALEVFDDLKTFANEIARKDSEPLFGFGFLLLRDFGLTVSGMDGPDEDRAITVFRRGRWDNNLDGMKRFPTP